MRTLHILKPGPLTTIQDLGRVGYEAYGVARQGALDRKSHTVANRLVGNAPDAATLEMTLSGGLMRFADTAWFAVTGGHADLRLSGEAVPGWTRLRAQPGDELAIGMLKTGARLYLAVDGGFAVGPQLGSRSTDVAAGLDGLLARPLKAGDQLPLGPAVDTPGYAAATDPPHYPNDAPWAIRVVAGPRRDHFSDAAWAAFLAGEYSVTPYSDRVGIRLAGPAVPPLPVPAHLSEGMPVGVIEAPPDGQPIILLNGRGTLGGYSTIATVITPDIWRLGQARPGIRLRFAAIDTGQAAAIARSALAAL